jgi:hypothetical protein
MSESPTSKVASVADVETLFSQDDKPVVADKPEKTEKPEKEDKTETETDPDEIKLREDVDDEEKIDLDEDGEEKKIEDDDEKKIEDDIEIDAPPRKKELLSKYPKILKEFPWFEKMIYRDKQYTELFGSFDDAREVYEQSQTVAEFTRELASGNIENILKQVKTDAPRSFDKIVDNYLLALSNVDPQAYLEVASNVGKVIIREIAKAARQNNDDELNKVAVELNKFLFGTTEYTPPKPRVSEKDENEDSEAKRERETFYRERFESVRDDLQTKVDNILRNTISDYIDPKNEMTGYVKKHAVRECLQSLHNTVKSDKAFRNLLDRLWQDAFSKKFSADTQRRIQSAYLGKSKGLLPAVIKKARAEALKDASPSSRKADEDDEKDNQQERREKRQTVPPGRPRQQGGKAQMQKGESVSDFFMRD